MNTRQRNVLSVSFSSLAAVALLTTADVGQAKPTDPEITAAVTRANANPDIEAVSTEANTTADRIGTNEIALTTKNVKTLASGLSDAIINKQGAVPTTSTDPNRDENKADEIAEVAAFIQEGVANNSKYQKLGTAKKITLTLLKGVLATAKKAGQLAATSLFRDVAGSVALTIHNDTAITDKNEIKLAKFLVKKSKSIGGKTNKAQVKAGLQQGFGGSTLYEDGNFDLLLVSDPESDIRNAGPRA